MSKSHNLNFQLSSLLLVIISAALAAPAAAEPTTRPRASRQIVFALDPAFSSPGRKTYSSVRKSLTELISENDLDCEILYGPADTRTSLDALQNLGLTFKTMKKIRQVIIMLGVQDREAELTAAHTKANIEQIMFLAKKSHPKVGFVLILPLVGTPDAADAESAELALLYESIAREANIELVTFPAPEPRRKFRATAEDTEMVTDVVWELILKTCQEAKNSTADSSTM